jgi:hypothetical protein
MKTLFKNILYPNKDHAIKEHLMAHDYPQHQKDHIKAAYAQRWGTAAPEASPLTHPWLFDPCTPPKGWIYDPFYELWLAVEQ